MGWRAACGAALLFVLCLAALSGCAGPATQDAGIDPKPGPPTDDGGSGGLQLPIGTTKARVSGGSEPMVLTDNQGKYVWIGDTTGGYISANNGTSWSPMAALAAGLHALLDGWALAQDEAGNLYAADLSDNHVDVGRSSDAGRSWNQVGYFAGVSGAADRPWIAAKGGDVVLFYFDAPAVAVGVYEHCARSTDGGMTFVDRDPVTGPPQAGKAFYDSEGRFYYSQSSGVLYRYTGSCLGNPTAIQMIPEAGVNNMIQTDVEGTDLYMAAATDVAKQITLAGSHNGDPPKKIVVSPPNLGANTFATVSVHAGQVAVAWYGSEGSGDPSSPGFSGSFDVHLAVVDDFWSESPRITHTKLTEEPIHSGYICMDGIGCTNGRGLLDYFMIDYDIWGGLHVAYVDDHAGNPAVQYLHLPPQGTGPGPDPDPEPGMVVADFTAFTEGLTLHVDASVSVGAEGFEWDWGDGTVGSGVTTSHTYETPGSYSITLTALASDGTQATHTSEVTVGAGDNALPQAAIGATPSVARPGQAIRFTDKSTDDGGIVLRSWSFGDGAQSAEENPSHAFDAVGGYVVRLEVTDAFGATDTATLRIVVTPTGESGEPSGDGTQGSAGPSAVMGMLGLLAMALLRRRL